MPEPRSINGDGGQRRHLLKLEKDVFIGGARTHGIRRRLQKFVGVFGLQR